MKVQLKSKETLESIYSEEDLKDLSILESIYTIRKLKALVESLENGFIEVQKENNSNQVYSEKYQIWFNDWEYLRYLTTKLK